MPPPCPPASQSGIRQRESGLRHQNEKEGRTVPRQWEKWGPCPAPLQTVGAVSRETPALSGPLFCHLQYSMGGIPRSGQTNATSWPQPVSKPEVPILFDSWTVTESLVLTQIQAPLPGTWTTHLLAPRGAVRPVLACEGEQVKVNRRDHFPAKEYKRHRAWVPG